LKLLEFTVSAGPQPIDTRYYPRVLKPSEFDNYANQEWHEQSVKNKIAPWALESFREMSGSSALRKG